MKIQLDVDLSAGRGSLWLRADQRTSEAVIFTARHRNDDNFSRISHIAFSEGADRCGL